MAQLTDQQQQAIEGRIFAGDKIEAIKLYRAAIPEAGLAESKASVEKIEQELRAKHPGRFVAAPKKSGCLGLAVALTVFGAAALVCAARFVGG